MKFTLSSQLLNNRLQTLAKVINSKNSMAILGCFLFDVRDGRLTITSSDNENVMSTVLDLDNVEGEGRFAVNAPTILNAVKELAEQPLSFDVDLESYAMTLYYLNGHYSFNATSAEEFPETKEVGEGATVITIDGNVLSECISRSLFATAEDQLRPVMGSIFFDLTPDCLCIVASDGHKLVRNRNYAIKSEVPASFILPKKPSTLLKGLFGKDAGDVVIKFDNQGAEISFATGRLNCALIEGRYPRYNSVIPQDNPNILTIDRKALLGALRRVLPFASESSQLVRLHIEAGRLEISSENIDFAKSAKEELVCDYAGQNMSIGFKGSSLTEILNNLNSDEVTMELADPSRAGVVVPVSQPENEEIVMLIMPMLLND